VLLPLKKNAHVQNFKATSKSSTPCPYYHAQHMVRQISHFYSQLRLTLTTILKASQVFQND